MSQENKSIDQLDRKILALLLKDARMNYKEIARRSKTSIGTVHNRIKHLQDTQLIKQFIPVLDNELLGFDLTVLIDIRIDGAHLEEIQQKYAKNKNICAIYDVTGDYDSTFVGRFENTARLNQFIKKLQREKYVSRTNTRFALKVVKEALSPTL